MANPLTKVILNNIVGKPQARTDNSVISDTNLTLEEERLLIKVIDREIKEKSHNTQIKPYLSKVTLEELGGRDLSINKTLKQTKGISLEELATKISRDNNND